jgi:hypothetical protein
VPGPSARSGRPSQRAAHQRLSREHDVTLLKPSVEALSRMHTVPGWPSITILQSDIRIRTAFCCIVSARFARATTVWKHACIHLQEKPGAMLTLQRVPDATDAQATKSGDTRGPSTAAQSYVAETQPQPDAQERQYWSQCSSCLQYSPIPDGKSSTRCRTASCGALVVRIQPLIPVAVRTSVGL